MVTFGPSPVWYLLLFYLIFDFNCSNSGLILYLTIIISPLPKTVWLQIIHRSSPEQSSDLGFWLNYNKAPAANLGQTGKVTCRSKLAEGEVFSHIGIYKDDKKDNGNHLAYLKGTLEEPEKWLKEDSKYSYELWSLNYII